MCEVTPYMVSVATKRSISVIYYSAALLISTTGVVYIYIYYSYNVVTRDIYTHEHEDPALMLMRIFLIMSNHVIIVYSTPQ